jgi:predicted RNA-binding protein with PIN domain
MIYLIDGHNLLHKFPQLKRRHLDNHEQVRDALVSMLLSYFCRLANVEIYLFFDNKTNPRGGRYNIRGVKVIYSKPHQSADELIRQRALRLLENSQTVIVVSDDRGIIDNVASGNIYAKSSKEFSFLLKQASSTPVEPRDKKVSSEKKLSDDEVDYWLTAFSAEETDD